MAYLFFVRIKDHGQVEPASPLLDPRGEAADVGLELLGHGIDLVGGALARVSKLLGSRQQLRCICVGVLRDVLEVLMALLIHAGLLQVATDPCVFAYEHLSVVRQPIQHLLHVLLE